MSETKFTKGSWVLGYGSIRTNVFSGGLRVARCDFDGDFDHPQAKANANLVVAAPELYEALAEMCAFWLEAIEKPDGEIPTPEDEARVEALAEKAHAALLKARGECQ